MFVEIFNHRQNCNSLLQQICDLLRVREKLLTDKKNIFIQIYIPYFKVMVLLYFILFNVIPVHTTLTTPIYNNQKSA